MKIEIRELMDDNEMLSHIFLGCVPTEKLMAIRDKYVGTGENAVDWRKESVKIPVEMKIGGVSVNPKSFFDSWKNQMQSLILAKAKEVATENMGSARFRAMQNRISEMENILSGWEQEINWETPNPFLEPEDKNEGTGGEGLDIILNTPLSELDFSIRYLKHFDYMGDMTVKDILLKTWDNGLDSLLERPNFGRKSLMEMIDTFETIWLRFFFNRQAGKRVWHYKGAVIPEYKL